MPSSPRIRPSTTSKLQHTLMPRPPRPFLLPLRSVWQPAIIYTPGSAQARLRSSLTDDWGGSSREDHAVNRSKKGDNTNPQAEAASAGMKDRKESEGRADGDKSQATTERGGVQHGNKAKKEHPKAPEPIIGMNDERGQKGD